MFFFGNSSFAACRCACVEGEKVPICDSTLEIPPLCFGICALPPPKIRPLQSPTIPPLGTTECVKKLVQNPYTGKYEWRTLCQ